MPINPSSHVPIYDQIVQHLRGAIAAGVYRAEEALPSVRALALELGVNPNTVQRAFQELEREGLVYGRRGLGMFAARRSQRTAQQRARTEVREGLVRSLELSRQAGIPIAQVSEMFAEAVGRLRTLGTEGVTQK